MTARALDQLLPPMDRVAARLRDVQRHSYFDGPFEHFEECLVRGVEWDFEPTLMVLPQAKAPVLELGCGSGRVSLVLAEHGYPVTAVDTSESALARLRVRIRQCGRHLEPIEILCSDALDGRLAGERTYPVVLFANLSLNLFGADRIDRLLRQVDRLLDRSGAFCFAILADRSVKNLASYDGTAAGSVFCQPYADEEGRERLMWSVVVVDPQSAVMRTNWFVDLQASECHPGRYHVATLTQQLWTPSRLYPVLERNGFTVECEVDASIGGGGADGEKTIFVRAVRRGG